jgi:hypothetical protein
MTPFSSSDAEAGGSRPQRQQLGPCLRGASRPLRNARITGNMDTSKPTKAAWDQSLSHTIEQVCERAILKLFSDAHDEATRQALAQAFLAGVDWCFSGAVRQRHCGSGASNRTKPRRSCDWRYSANGLVEGVLTR